MTSKRAPRSQPPTAAPPAAPPAVADGAPAAGPVQQIDGEVLAESVEMPTVENEAASTFQPRPGCKILDVYEITLMYLLELTSSPVDVAPGALRGVQLPARRVHQLSESARQHMSQVASPE